jgi:hypothetical protein
VLPDSNQKGVLEEYIQAVDTGGERVERLETKMRELLEEWEWKPVVEALMAMKGFQIVAAMITISELGDLTPFAHPRQLMAFLGLVPSEEIPFDWWQDAEGREERTPAKLPTTTTQKPTTSVSRWKRDEQRRRPAPGDVLRRSDFGVSTRA